MKKLLLWLILTAFFSVATPGQTLVLGNPSGAATDVNSPDNYLVAHANFILSYNRERGAANWVTWHLSKPDIGGVDRSEAFAPDSKLPAAWRIKPNDYRNSGYDRGHLCPSKDRSSAEAANIETFLMSNMQPQTAELNRKTWRYLEDYTRSEVARNREAYVFAGCYGNKGRIAGRVTIPTNCYKIIVLLAAGNNDISRINSRTRVIVVDMPNADTLNRRWRAYLTTVDDLEEKTGYDFLSALPDDIETALESRRDNQ